MATKQKTGVKKNDQSSRHLPNAPNEARKFRILPWSPQWNAWLAHYRGTKTETRMLASLGAKPGAKRAAWWFEESKFPPAAPRADGIVRREAAKKPTLPTRAAVLAATMRLAQSIEARENPALDISVSGAKKRRLERARSEARGLRRRNTVAFDERLKIALKEVSDGRVPDVEACDTLGTIETTEIVIDKDDAGYFVRRRTARKVVNLRADPVGRMAKRGQISALQLKAALFWQALYQIAEVGGASGIDPTRGRSSGGGSARMPDPFVFLKLIQIDAMLVRNFANKRGKAFARFGALVGAKLGKSGGRECGEKIGRRLGERHGKSATKLLRCVLVDRVTFAQIAAATGDAGKARAEIFWSMQFRECLSLLVAFLGLDRKVIGSGMAAGGRTVKGGEVSVAWRAHPFGVDEAAWDDAESLTDAVNDRLLAGNSHA